ncbi:MAG: type II toxin-antitoxin system VapC family toxin [Sphingomicrobium sp.]|nr:type II toxin-antitoxin system VapC family toxin [Sphingomonadales bacterium]
MILLDTHVLVWLATGDRRLPDGFRERVEEGEGLATSAVVAFEYSDLCGRGRLARGLSFAHIVDSLSLRVEPLPADVWRVLDELPSIHGDPVDRMLISHTLMLGGVLATADRKMRSYPVPLAW